MRFGRVSHILVQRRTSNDTQIGMIAVWSAQYHTKFGRGRLDVVSNRRRHGASHQIGLYTSRATRADKLESSEERQSCPMFKTAVLLRFWPWFTPEYFEESTSTNNHNHRNNYRTLRGTDACVSPPLSANAKHENNGRHGP